MSIRCDKCHKDITKNYCKLSYKIVNNKDIIETYKGVLCRNCLTKIEETKLAKAKQCLRVSEEINLDSFKRHAKH